MPRNFMQLPDFKKDLGWIAGVKEYIAIRLDAVNHYKPKRVGEIGVWRGVSACALVCCDDVKEYVGIDINTENCFKVVRLRLKYTNKHLDVELLEQDSMELHKLPGEPFDFIHIDGCHDTEYVLHDAVISLFSLKPGGILLFHDYHRSETREGIDQFLEKNKKDIAKVYFKGDVNVNSNVFVQKAG